MQKDILERFTAEVVRRTQSIRIGDPLLEDTRMGPLINKPHLERVLGFVRGAKEQVSSRGLARQCSPVVSVPRGVIFPDGLSVFSGCISLRSGC